MPLDFSGLVALRQQAPTPLFVAYLIVFFESMAYISGTLILTAFLSASLGFTDAQAGWIYSAFGISTTVLSVIGGFVIDKFGFRSMMLFGSFFAAAGRLAMALTTSKYVFVAVQLTMVPLGGCLVFCSLLTAVRRYTSIQTRSFGFSFFYICLNLGALCGGFFTDAIRHSVGYDQCLRPTAVNTTPMPTPLSFPFTPTPATHDDSLAQSHPIAAQPASKLFVDIPVATSFHVNLRQNAPSATFSSSGSFFDSLLLFSSPPFDPLDYESESDRHHKLHQSHLDLTSSALTPSTFLSRSSSTSSSSSLSSYFVSETGSSMVSPILLNVSSSPLRFLPQFLMEQQSSNPQSSQSKTSSQKHPTKQQVQPTRPVATKPPTQQHQKTILGVSVHDAYRLVFLIGALVTFMLPPLIYFFIEQISVDELTGDIINEDANSLGSYHHQGQNSDSSSSSSNSPHQDNHVDSVSNIFSDVMHQSSFWKLTALVFLLMGVKQVHRQLDATLPKYLIRSVGCDAAFGSIFAINPFLVIFLVPITTALAAGSHPLSSIQIGCVLASVAPFVFFAPPSFTTAALFVVLLSIGESLIAPRMTEYSASVAPKGREGSYLALSHTPNFFAKVLSGFSGQLLNKHCSCIKSVCEPCCTRVLQSGEVPCANGKYLWMVVASIAIGCTILLLLFRSWLQHDIVPVSSASSNSAASSESSSSAVDLDFLEGDEDDDENAVLLSSTDSSASTKL